jgi:hypothetical protein
MNRVRNLEVWGFLTSSLPYIAISALFLVNSVSVQAQEPRFTNANVQRYAVPVGRLEAEVRARVTAAVSPVWIGWAVPVEREHQMCCWSADRYSGCCGGCKLETAKGESFVSGENLRAVKLEGPQWMLVLLRAEQRSVGKLRTFSEDCQIDAGGLVVHWLTGVSPAESIALLRAFVRDTGSSDEERPARRMSDAAVMAIALHADPAADRALDDFAAAGQPEKIREQAIFWMGSARGRGGLERLRRIVREDASPRIREKAIFALHVNKEPASVDEIIRAAKEDSSARVRGQALFWLAQRAGAKASEAITEAIENDPETEVKKRAVFALSQLPKEEGVPKLIQIARTNKNPAVRKQAMFWLGQSNDSRALAFFEDVLRK